MKSLVDLPPIHRAIVITGPTASGKTTLAEKVRSLLKNKLSPEQVAYLARGSLRRKIPQIVEALEGHRMRDHHRLLIRQTLKHR